MTPHALPISTEAPAEPDDDLGVRVAGHYGDPAGELSAMQGSVAMVDRSARGAVTVTGTDTLRFLQDLLSQDLADLGDGEGAHALLLQPQGKLDVDLRLLRIADEELRLDCEVGMGAHLAASLECYRIRVKVQIEDRAETEGCIMLRGPKTIGSVAAVLGAEAPPIQHHHVVADSGLRVVRANWPGPTGPDGSTGVDLIGSRAALTAAWTTLRDSGVQPAGLDAYETARIIAGIPRQGRDLDERTIPQEAFLDGDAVSFTKGCFIGQELVCRIDTRGHVNRYLRLLSMEPDDSARTPSSIATLVGAQIVFGAKVVGEVTSVARLSTAPGKFAALGYVRREVQPPSEVAVSTPTGAIAATVEALP